MKIISKNIICGIVLGIIFLFSYSVSFAQTNPQPGQYTILQPLPGIQGQPTLSEYLPAIFNLTIGIAVALAFIYITIGGVLYATSDAINNKAQGREYIENALLGLLLVIGSYVILYTINPDILNFNLSLQGVPRNDQSTGVTPVPTTNTCCSYTNGVLNGYILTAAEQQENARLIEVLRNGNVQVNANACSTGNTTGCTNIVGLPQTVIDRLISLRNACNTQRAGCLVTVTGGTEGGHRTHGPNRPTVDLSPSSTLNTYLGTINVQARNPVEGTQVNLPGGGTATYEVTGSNGRATGAHWHVQF